jgi:hypothetical protein
VHRAIVPCCRTIGTDLDQAGKSPVRPMLTVLWELCFRLSLRRKPASIFIFEIKGKMDPGLRRGDENRGAKVPEVESE